MRIMVFSFRRRALETLKKARKQGEKTLKNEKKEK